MIRKEERCGAPILEHNVDSYTFHDRCGGGAKEQITLDLNLAKLLYYTILYCTLLCYVTVYYVI